jgi:hypothetical protein
VPMRARRLRIARCLDELSLPRLASLAQPGGGARIELVLAGGRRVRIAQAVDDAGLRALVVSAEQHMDARIELVSVRGMG